MIANAKALAEGFLMGAGFRLISGGTDNHLILIDMTSKGLTGKIAEAALGRAGITVNKNLIPFDQRKPMDPSGIRMGTPALTTRGMKEDAIRQVATWIISTILAAPDDGALAARTREAIRGILAATLPGPRRCQDGASRPGLNRPIGIQGRPEQSANIHARVISATLARAAGCRGRITLDFDPTLRAFGISDGASLPGRICRARVDCENPAPRLRRRR